MSAAWRGALMPQATIKNEAQTNKRRMNIAKRDGVIIL
jgi:hypothetical protein